MATAPTPRDVAAAKGDTEPRRVISITDARDGRTLSLDLDDLGPGDDLRTRKATGYPATAFVSDGDKIGTDGVAVLWWLMRIKAGDKVTFEQVVDDMGSFRQILEQFTVVFGEPDEDEEGIEGADPLDPPESSPSSSDD